MKNNIRKKAMDIVSNAETTVLSSIDEGGWPRAVTMSNIKAEGLETIWFATGTTSAKVKHYKENNKASVCYSAGNNGITLIGDMEIVDDMDVKKALWTDWFIAHFPGGVTDPEYCILKFVTKDAVLWIDNVFEKFSSES
ncbi:pyridoxamine 5'-phosphate oxidase family protein [Geosporobacter ferrireducens]|uniref:General stress protein n=1 Tax=Geosporobacter ferrireducens TaxID=1424294 RepID=A0A1D8GD85_9FIRM|nr:pyridoxamine 5'-phosphate oxidase family protein [Geosporobacter ferrireducens]AOT68856.1 general stress protein [Geosporobacter ferrireducens]MTI54911.1 general stress protein [Geosporobacter ferrireducens]